MHVVCCVIELCMCLDQLLIFLSHFFVHCCVPRAGKDRTSMGVTLENTRALVEDVGVLNGQEVRYLNLIFNWTSVFCVLELLSCMIDCCQ